MDVLRTSLGYEGGLEMFHPNLEDGGDKKKMIER
jgi:hypothetical protein